MALVGSLYTSLTLESSSFVSGLKKAAASAERAGQVVERAMTRAQTAAVAFAGVISLRSMANAARGLASVIDSAKSVEAQLKLATKSSLDFVAMQQSAARAARDFGQSYEGTVGMVSALARSTQEMGLTLQEQDELTRSLMANIRISGASADAVSNAMLQFRQAMEGGVFRAEEFNSINENTPQILRAVAEGLGVTTGALRQMMLDGKLTSETVAKALITVREESERQAAQIPPRWDQAWTRITDITRQAIVKFDEGGEFSATLLSFADRAVKGFDDIGDSAFRMGLEVRTQIATLKNELRPLADLLEPLAFLEGGKQLIKDWWDPRQHIDRATWLLRAPLAAGHGLDQWSSGGSFLGGFSNYMQTSSFAHAWNQSADAQRQALVDQREAKQLGEFISEMVGTMPGAGVKPAATIIDKEALKAAKKELQEIDSVISRFLTERTAMETYAKRLDLLDKGLKRNRLSADELALAGQRVRAAWLDDLGLEKIEASIAKFDPNKLIKKSLPTFDAKELQRLEGQRQITEELERSAERARQLDQTATQFAATMTSGFEDAIFAGKGLRSVFGGLLEDMGRMVIRLTVMEPLARSFADALKGSGGLGGGGGGGIFTMIGSLFGGKREHGGPVTGGMTYLVGERGPELFTAPSSGSIIPNGALKGYGGGGRNISITVNAQDAVLASTVKGWVQEAVMLGASGGSAMAQQDMIRQSRRRL